MKLVPVRFLPVAAITITPRLVLIRASRQDDAALIAHEKVHCQQMRAVGTLKFHWSYATSRYFRMAAEIEAYRVQLRFQPWRLDDFAKTLSGAWPYFLFMSEHEARAALT